MYPLEKSTFNWFSKWLQNGLEGKELNMLVWKQCWIYQSASWFTSLSLCLVSVFDPWNSRNSLRNHKELMCCKYEISLKWVSVFPHLWISSALHPLLRRIRETPSNDNGVTYSFDTGFDRLRDIRLRSHWSGFVSIRFCWWKRCPFTLLRFQMNTQWKRWGFTLLQQNGVVNPFSKQCLCYQLSRRSQSWVYMLL